MTDSPIQVINSLPIFNSEASEGFVRAVTGVLKPSSETEGYIPSPIMSFLASKGWKIMVKKNAVIQHGDSIVVDIDRPNHRAIGGVDKANKTIYFYENRLDAMSGNHIATTQQEVQSVIRHEFGHAIDFTMGWSDSPVFQERHQQDVAAMEEEARAANIYLVTPNGDENRGRWEAAATLLEHLMTPAVLDSQAAASTPLGWARVEEPSVAEIFPQCFELLGEHYRGLVAKQSAQALSRQTKGGTS